MQPVSFRWQWLLAALSLHISISLLLAMADGLARAEGLEVVFLGGLSLLSGVLAVRRLREARPTALVLAGIAFIALIGAVAVHLLIKSTL